MTIAPASRHNPIPIHELDLYRLPWNTPEMAADPYPHIAAARCKHPWLAVTDEGYVVIGYQAIRDLMELDREDKLRPSFDGIIDILGARDTPWGRFTAEQMLALSGEEHKVLRDTFAAKFTPRYANQIRPLMRKIMRSLLEEWLPKGSFDFAEFASYYPVSVMTSMIGAPLSVIPGLRESLETLGRAYSLNPDLEPALQKAILHLDDFCHELVAERRRNPLHEGPEDLLDMLIEASNSGGIPERQLIDMLIFLFEAGYDTSKNVFTYMMWEMTRHPEIYRKCGEDLEYCRKAVEEFLRYFNPSHSFRFTNADIVYDGVFIPKDTMLFFSLIQSGRDPAVFERPDEFDPERTIDPARRHLAFGLGKHMCLGQYIARAQIQEGLHLCARHMRNPSVAGPVTFRPYPGIYGLETLPLAFDPA
ncbi:MAG: cytochrome P450 [Novosphingobium sp.]|nr:cytochrome P450 [Novosphingobium sp.]